MLQILFYSVGHECQSTRMMIFLCESVWACYLVNDARMLLAFVDIRWYIVCSISMLVYVGYNSRFIIICVHLPVGQLLYSVLQSPLWSCISHRLQPFPFKIINLDPMVSFDLHGGLNSRGSIRVRSLNVWQYRTGRENTTISQSIIFSRAGQ